MSGSDAVSLAKRHSFSRAVQMAAINNIEYY